MAPGPTTSWQIEVEKVDVSQQISSSWAPKSLSVTVTMKSEDSCFLAGKL